MTISSATIPEIASICRTLLRRELIEAVPIGEGRNSRVVRVVLRPDDSDAPAMAVIKFYRREANDTRDRLAAEFGGLEFLWRNGIRAIPRPIVADPSRDCAVYEYLEGTVPDSRHVSAADIDACVRFLALLKELRAQTMSAQLPAASEACFSLHDITASIAARYRRLEEVERDGNGDGLHRWLERTFEPLLRASCEWCQKEAPQAGIDFDERLHLQQRTLSPSDFGFHNAIRRPDGSLAFVDFEYFGWDDPAKTVVDFILHPGMPVTRSLGRRFVTSFLAQFADIPRLAERVRLVYPLFGLKWCLILLNEFLPERQPAISRLAAQSIRAAQLAKADAMAARIRDEYRLNPWLT